MAFFGPHSIDYAITCYGILGCGAAVSPVRAAYTPMELQAQLETSGAKFLMAHSFLLATVEKTITFHPHFRVIQADGARDKSGAATAETLAQSCPLSPLVSIQPDEVDDRLALIL